MSRPTRQATLVSDFDGTMTRRDFYQLVLARLVPPGTTDFWGEYLTGRITHFEAIRSTFLAGKADEATLAGLAEEMGLEPDLATDVERLRAAGWEVVVASAGCTWYIDRLLRKAGVRLAVHANPGRIEDGRLVMQSPTDSPFHSPLTGIDKQAIVRSALERGGPVAFAGDGPPDLPPALLVAERYRFARGYLAGALRERGVGFRHYDRWSDVAHMLASEAPAG